MLPIVSTTPNQITKNVLHLIVTTIPDHELTSLSLICQYHIYSLNFIQLEFLEKYIILSHSILLKSILFHTFYNYSKILILYKF